MQINYKNIILNVATTYFNHPEIKNILKELNAWEITDDLFFCQLSQKDEEPMLEISLASKNVIVDYTYRKSETRLHALLISDIKGSSKIEDKNSTTVNIYSSSSLNLIYQAHTENFREKLNHYYNTLQSKIINNLR